MCCPLEQLSMSGAEKAFKHGILGRGGRCVILRGINISADLNIWAGYKAADVSPLEYEER